MAAPLMSLGQVTAEDVRRAHYSFVEFIHLGAGGFAVVYQSSLSPHLQVKHVKAFELAQTRKVYVVGEAEIPWDERARVADLLNARRGLPRRRAA